MEKLLPDYLAALQPSLHNYTAGLLDQAALAGQQDGQADSEQQGGALPSPSLYD